VITYCKSFHHSEFCKLRAINDELRTTHYRTHVERTCSHQMHVRVFSQLVEVPFFLFVKVV
jgi:hypothetical protein